MSEAVYRGEVDIPPEKTPTSREKKIKLAKIIVGLLLPPIGIIMAGSMDGKNTTMLPANKGRVHQALWRLMLLGLTTTTLAYLCYFLNHKSNALNLWTNSWMNPSIVNFLNNNKWLVISLISLLAISILYQTSSYVIKNAVFLIKGNNIYERISFTNYKCNKKNILNLPFLFSILTYIGIGYCVSEQKANMAVNMIYGITSSIDFTIKKLLVITAITIASISLYSCFSGKAILPFNIIPDFIQNSKGMLIGASVIVGLTAVVFLINLVIDIFNIAGKTLEWRGMKRLANGENLENPSGNGQTLKTQYQFPIVIRDIIQGERYNRGIGDLIDEEVISRGVDKVKEGANFVLNKMQNCCGKEKHMGYE